jgi:hypothetical protein
MMIERNNYPGRYDEPLGEFGQLADGLIPSRVLDSMELHAVPKLSPGDICSNPVSQSF